MFGNISFEILKADESYLKKVEEYLTDIINNPITGEHHSEAAIYLTGNNTLGTSFKDDSYIYWHHLLDKLFVHIICPSSLKNFL